MKLSTPLAPLVAALIQATSAGAAPGYDGRNGRAFITAGGIVISTGLVASDHKAMLGGSEGASRPPLVST